MTWFVKIVGLLLATFFVTTPAHAGPLAAIVPVVVGFLKVSAIAKLAITLAATVAISVLSKMTQKRNQPGITIERTAQGGTNPRTLIFGKYCTGGSEVTPPMSYGTVDKAPNGYLVRVIALADAPIVGLTRLIMNGEYVPLISGGTNSYNFGGKYFGKGFVTILTGDQTTANTFLTSNLGSYPNRPWSSQRVGKGVAYAIVCFNYDPEIYKGEPDVRFEVQGMKLYDPRKDSSVGGSGTQRWATPSTWAFTENPIVMTYNVLRGITLSDGTRYGGECTAEELPFANWVAAMNVCDENVVTTMGNQLRYRAGYECLLSDEPADVIEELLKTASAEISEVAGVYKVRAGPPSLPVLFVTDEDFIITKPQELDSFPPINSSFNTVSAVFPHPDELWAQHDAPRVQKGEYVTRDDGREMVADLQFPACPFPLQVQRNMLAWLEDDQRWRRHTGTLRHHAFSLEPLDVISWTSARNQYVNKTFEVASTTINLTNLQPGIAMREVNPSDYAWNSGMEIPDPVSSGGWELPVAQPVAGFTVDAYSIMDNDADARRPAIRCTWDATAALDAFAIRIEVRLAVSHEAVASITVANVGTGEQIISEGILPAVSYEVRARYLVDRPTEWTVWHGVTTGDVRLTTKDFNFDELVAGLGESIVLPDLTRPLKGGLIEGLFTAALNEVDRIDQHFGAEGLWEKQNTDALAIIDEAAQRTNADAVIDYRVTEQSVRVDEAVASIIAESIIRADGDTALAQLYNTLSVTVGNNHTVVTGQTAALASADLALGVRIDNLTTTVGGNTTSITNEVTARANADTALGTRIDNLTTTVGNNHSSVTSSIGSLTSADTALGTRIDNLTTTVGGNTTAINNEVTARTTADSALGTRIDNLTTTVNGNYSSFTSSINALTTDVSGLVTTVDTLETAVDSAVSAISNEAIVRANADTALSGTVTSLTARLNNAGGTGVTVEQAFTAQANSIGTLSASYSVRINANGKISGFGLASGAGGTSEFAVLADRFVITDPANNSVQGYPFQVVGGAVYIRKAFIQSITTEQIGANQITATHINVANLAAISANVGNLDIRPGTSTAGRIRIYDASNVLRVIIGNLA